MGITRANLGLLLAVVVLLVLRLAFGGSRTSATQDTSAFTAFDPGAILRLTLTAPGDGPTKALVVSRTGTHAPWTVEARSNYPALAYPIQNLLGAIDNLRLTDVVSEEASSHELFGVTEVAGLGLRLESPGAAAWDFVLGGSAREGGGTTGYLRALSESRVLAAPGLGSQSLSPRAWINPSLVDFDVTLITRIEFVMPELTLAMSRNDKGIWREESRNTEAPRVALEGLIGEIKGLVLTDISERPFDPVAQGLGKSATKIVLSGNPKLATAFDPIEITLGAVESDALRAAQGGGDSMRQYVRSGAWTREGGHSWVGLLDGDAANALLTHVLEILTALL